MPNDPSRVAVEFTNAFKRDLRALSKKYHHIRSDLQPTLETIESGDLVGDRVQGTEFVVFKVRVRNRDIQKGKSSGYRLIYQLKTPTSVVLITIYSKLDQGDISSAQIRGILNKEE
jgi:mRNA-degrading endonuclease RelE of RelBE toxin-antitoxin system